MNYNKLYRRFIESRPIRRKEYNKGLETHHILPRSLGGKNTRNNLIVLTAREHFIAHMLLVRLTSGLARAKMANALNRMSTSGRYRLTARTYESVRIAWAKERANLTTIFSVGTRQLLKERADGLWADPEYVAKQKTYRSSEERRAISRQTMLVNRSKMKQLPKRGKVDPAQRLARLYIKYGTHPTRSQRYYIRQIAKQSNQ